MEHTLNRSIVTLLLAASATLAACHKDNSQNDALSRDLNLANQASSAAQLDSISAAERGYAAPAATSPTRAANAPTYQAARRHRSSSAGSYGTYSAPASRPTLHRNTKRDAAIGAGAGAILGAASSRNKVKGGIIGAVVGGVLGGVIGNNVDVKKTP